MSLVLRSEKGSKLTIEEVDNNFIYLDNKQGGGLSKEIFTVTQSSVQGFLFNPIIESPGPGKMIDVISAYIIPNNITNPKTSYEFSDPRLSNQNSYLIISNGVDKTSLIMRETLSLYTTDLIPRYFQNGITAPGVSWSTNIINEPLYVKFGGRLPIYTAIPFEGSKPDPETIVTGLSSGATATCVGVDGYLLLQDSSFNGDFQYGEILEFSGKTCSITEDTNITIKPWDGTLTLVVTYQIIDLT